MDSFDQSVDRFGWAVGDAGVVPVDDGDRVRPRRRSPGGRSASRRSSQFAELGAGELGAVDVVEAAEGFFGVPRQADFAVGVADGEQAAEFGVSCVGEAFVDGDE